MNKAYKNLSESGNIGFNILLILILIAIGILAYVLFGGDSSQRIRTIGVASPENTMIASEQESAPQIFTDGLNNPDFINQSELDELGEGISETAIFNIDINNDGKKDRITRTRHENATAHFFYEYKIELKNNNSYKDITPKGFRTTEGAECALGKLQFVFKPDFKVIKISRPWKTSWNSPSMATKTTYTIVKNTINQIDSVPVKEICDVTELFF